MGELELYVAKSKGKWNTVPLYSSPSWAFIYFDRLGMEEVSVKDNIFKVTSKGIKFYSDNNNCTTYEIELSAFQDDDLWLRMSGKEYQDKFKADEYGEINLFEFVERYKVQGTDLLYKFQIEYSYATEYYEFRMNGDKLFIICSRLRKEKREDKVKTKPVIQDISIADKIHFQMSKDVFIEVLMQTYNMESGISISVEEVNIPGHCIYIPCIELRAKEYRIMFDGLSVKDVSFSEQIADDSYFTNSLGQVYSIRELIDKNRREDRGIYIDVQGADNVWHYVHRADSRYAYSLGFNL